MNEIYYIYKYELRLYNMYTQTPSIKNTQNLQSNNKQNTFTLITRSELYTYSSKLRKNFNYRFNFIRVVFMFPVLWYLCAINA